MPNIQNEFKTVQNTLMAQSHEPIILTNVHPAPDDHFDVRMGGFSQWTRRGIPMSTAWDRKIRELHASIMANIILAHWIAVGRPDFLNIPRCASARDTTKVYWFLDL